MSLLYHNDTIIKKEKELLRALLIQFCKLEVVLFFTILNVIDNTSNSCNHRKQNSSAHCLIQGIPAILAIPDTLFFQSAFPFSDYCNSWNFVSPML